MSQDDPRQGGHAGWAPVRPLQQWNPVACSQLLTIWLPSAAEAGSGGASLHGWALAGSASPALRLSHQARVAAYQSIRAGHPARGAVVGNPGKRPDCARRRLRLSGGHCRFAISGGGEAKPRQFPAVLSRAPLVRSSAPEQAPEVDCAQCRALRRQQMDSHRRAMSKAKKILPTGSAMHLLVCGLSPPLTNNR